jgi:F-type H+-transporting ATPase subunit beta
LAQDIRRTLAQNAELNDINAMLGLEQLYPEHRNVVARPPRIERFITQPIFTNEQITGLTRTLVRLEDAQDGCERILHDEFKDIPESALYMIGAIDEVKADQKPTADSKPNAKSEPHTNPGGKPQSKV